MLSKFVGVGDKVELRTLDRTSIEYSTNESRKTFFSSIYGICSEDTLEIIMPIEQGKLVLLSIDSEYEMFYYTESGFFQSLVRIIDRYRTNNVYVLLVELTSNLSKYQRREYYRYSCALEMLIRPLTKEEVSVVENSDIYIFREGLTMQRSTIVDISGGGLRFLSTECYEQDTYLYCSCYLIDEDECKKYEMVGKILTVKEAVNQIGYYEHRMSYYNIDKETREEIIKYIFEEERKSRRKGRFL